MPSSPKRDSCKSDLPEQQARSDPSSLGFLKDVLQTMYVLCVIAVALSAIFYRSGLGGTAAGGVFSIVLFLVLLRIGVGLGSMGNIRAAAGIAFEKIVVFGSIFILIVVAKFDPVGMVLGTSILPASIVVTLGRYRISGRKALW